MSTKLAIVDIDGVVADATARFAKAEEAKQRYIVQMQEEFSIQDERGATDAYWQTAFKPEYVPLDTLIEGVNDALNTLLSRGYKVLFLTSRKVDMAVATLEWFSLHIFTQEACDIVFKMPAFYYTKTVVWKAGMVQTLAMLSDASKVIFVDDEEANWTALKNNSGWALPYHVNWFASLAEAVEALKEE